MNVMRNKYLVKKRRLIERTQLQAIQHNDFNMSNIDLVSVLKWWILSRHNLNFQFFTDLNYFLSLAILEYLEPWLVL